MSNNFVLWREHYKEVLEDIYDRLVVLYETNNTPPPTYDYFLAFSYENTKKTISYHKTFEKITLNDETYFKQVYEETIHALII